MISGKGDGIDPQGYLTRAEMAALLYKALTYTPIQDVPTGPEEPVDPVEPEEPVDPEGPVDPEEPIEPQLPDPSQYTLTLDHNEVTLKSGESVPLTASLAPAWEGAEISWTSSDPSAAPVSSKGAVTNLYTGTGTASVTITASWNGLSASCTVLCQQAAQTGTVTDAELGLNVRSGPGSDRPVIGGLDNGTCVVILGQEAGWYQVLYLNRAGQAAIGYVSADYLTVN